VTVEQREGTRLLAWEGCLNARDLGGYQTGDGRETRWGAVVGSDSPAALTEAGRAALADCAAGKDRTGLISALLLGLAGDGARLREGEARPGRHAPRWRAPGGARHGTTLPEVRSPPVRMRGASRPADAEPGRCRARIGQL
jgi:hypothetical protein